MNKFRFFPNQRGVTIMEVVVVAAIGSIIMLAMATMFSELFKNQNRMQFQGEAYNFAEDVRSILSKPSVCYANFKDEVVTAASVSITRDEIVKEADASATTFVVAFKKDERYENGKVRLHDMTLSTLEKDGGTGLSGRMQLQLGLDNPADASTSSARVVGLRVQYDGTGKLTGCFALNVRSDREWTIWQRGTGSNLKDIYVGDGNLGIGTSTPQADFHLMRVGAPARLVLHNPEEQSVFLEMAGTGGVGGPEGFEMEYVNNSGNTVFRNRYAGGGASEGNVLFYTATSAGGTQPVMAMTKAGSVGVGTSAPTSTLEVSGEVKAGSTGVACDAGTSGAIRSAAGVLQTCIPPTWTPLIAGTPQSLCGTLGGTWNGTACGFSQSPTDTCTQLGGVPNKDGQCTFGGTPIGTTIDPKDQAPTPQSFCASLGGTWTGNGCNMPMQGGGGGSDNCALCTSLGRYCNSNGTCGGSLPND